MKINKCIIAAIMLAALVLFPVAVFAQTNNFILLKAQVDILSDHLVEIDYGVASNALETNIFAWGFAENYTTSVVDTLSDHPESTWSSNGVSLHRGEYSFESCISTNYGTVESLIRQGTLTNVIKELVAKGHICDVLGHRWENTPYYMTLEYSPDSNYASRRKCGICGLSQVKQPGEWK